MTDCFMLDGRKISMTIYNKIFTGISTLALSLTFAAPVLATAPVEAEDSDETKNRIG